VAGIDLEVDEPKKPDLVAEYTPQTSINDTADKILDSLLGGKKK